jgi:hypothetical protein
MARCRLLPASWRGGAARRLPALMPGSGPEPGNQFAILKLFPGEANIAAASRVLLFSG